MTFGDVMRLGQEGKLKTIVVLGERQAVVETREGARAAATMPLNQTWATELAKAGVNIEFQAPDQSTLNLSLSIFSVVVQGLGLFLMAGLVVWLLRTARSKMAIADFVKPRDIKDRILFQHVAGADDGKEALKDIVDYLRDPSRFEAVGAKPRNGVLLVGDPGNGKTLLAKAVAGEAGVPFMACSGSQFQEMFAGVGAARVRSMFKKLRKAAPAILFIDEIDSLGKKRSSSSSSVENDSANTLNELLTQLDGLTSGSGIVIIGATNRVEVLDPALIRAGRFDMHVIVPSPDQKARTEILKVASRDVELADDVDFATIARGTSGFSGADLAILVNEAAILAGKRSAHQVTMADFDQARDNKILGGTRGTLMIDPAELETIIVHESGHALANVLLPACDPIHKGTVTPRGRSLGHIATMPLKDRVLVTRTKFLSELVMLLAGRAAEEIFFGADMVTSGATSDSDLATTTAFDMVARYGMGSSMASRVGSSRPLSEETKRRVDEEVEEIIRASYERAKELLLANKPALDRLCARFREEDTLDGDEIRRIVAESSPAVSAAA
ncbi:ATP-dependent zinc metalloprotease FtsH (plasmid) [Bosea sp. ANAM02]|nr:ATP-dependent zinc metalloprotease FtsH [Bosea sp. ANAM02]